MSCTATLTTATVEPCPEDEACPPGLMHFWGEIGKQHVTLHTLTCVDPDCGTLHRNDITGKTTWRDGTPGASPHVELLVTEAEVEAAYDAVGFLNVDRIDLRKILGAAARVRKEAQA